MEKGAEASPAVTSGAMLPTTIADTWIERLTKFYLIPEGPFLANWERFLVLLTVVNCCLLSFMVAFNFQDTTSWVISYCIDFVFLVDIYLKFHVAYLQNGFWVVFPREMSVHYLHSNDFIYDVFCSLPYDLIALGWIGKRDAMYILCLVRLPKFIRVAKMLVYFRRQEKKLHASFAIQIIKFACYLLTLTHSIACIWFSVACPKGTPESCSTPAWTAKFGLHNDAIDMFRTSLGSIYISTLYWTITTMTTCGYGDITPQNDGERVFAIFAMTSGTFFYGYVSGTIASALSNMDSRRVSYQQKMDAIRQYMTDRAMDSDMQERVLEYYDYVWERNKGIDVKNLFEDMPSTFKSEVALSLNNAIIDNATIFHGCSIGFRRMIAIAMKLYFFTANEYVIHKGDIGNEMFFVTQGRIDIYATEDLKRPTASLIEGAHFGEYQVILEYRHEYSARAVCNTDIYVLQKSDLELAFEAYPDDKALVAAATAEKYKQAQNAKKSRQAKEQALDDLEEEFGIGSSPVTPVLLAEPTGPIRQSRKMSVDLSGYLLRDRPRTSEGSLSQKSKHSRHGISANLKAENSAMSVESRHNSLSRRASMNPQPSALRGEDVPAAQICITLPSENELNRTDLGPSDQPK
ncbi:Kinesin-like protein kif27 [Chytridiales sp. JEL 0842]|nr:Kinesin-like protein kif27 [Chytridiales sp. JEL 0842]